MRICLYDGPNRSDLLPLVYTRPVAELLIGSKTLANRWSHALDAELVVETAAYLQPETPSFDLITSISTRDPVVSANDQ